MASPNPSLFTLLLTLLFLSPLLVSSSRHLKPKRHRISSNIDESLTYIWPLPLNYTSGNQTLTVYPNLSLVTTGNGGKSDIVAQAFERYKSIVFKHSSSKLPAAGIDYDLTRISIVVHSDDEEVVKELDVWLVDWFLSCFCLFGVFVVVVVL